MSIARTLLVGTLLAASAAPPAFADAVRTATIQPGKVTRIGVVTALKSDCSVGSVGTITVISAPKNGSAVVRSGDLTTPGSYRCPNKKTAVQALFYEPNRNYTGQDEVAYEAKGADGSTERFTIKINITKTPAKGGILDL